MQNPLERKNWYQLALIITLVLTLFQLRHQGRRWFCECEQLRFWTSEADGSHTSQHLSDPYSFTHFQHGLILFWLVGKILPKLSVPWKLWLAIAIESGWEILENSAFVINRYRESTAALGYSGDSVLNSMGDILFCTAGFLLAHRVGWKKTWIVFWIIEAGLLITIRDSLFLSVLMLIMPLDFIKQWQLS